MTLFSMLPKKMWPLQPAEFNPIANIRLLYTTFAYFLRGQLEHFLEAGQPEEQHGFRPGGRLEEHLVTANLMLDKGDAVGIPCGSLAWILSGPKGMVVKVLLAYGPDCNWGMAWLAGSRLAVSSVRTAWHDGNHPRPRSCCSGPSCVEGALP